MSSIVAKPPEQVNPTELLRLTPSLMRAVGIRASQGIPVPGRYVGNRCAHREVYVMGRIPRGQYWADTYLCDAETGREADILFPVSDVLITAEIAAELRAIDRKLRESDRGIAAAFGAANA